MATIKKVINNGDEYCIGGKEYSVATETCDGLMSAADKKKLNGIGDIQLHMFCYLIVGGGGGGSNLGGGGGGGEVGIGQVGGIVKTYCVEIGCGGAGTACYKQRANGCNGGNSIFHDTFYVTSIKANGGCGGVHANGNGCGGKSGSGCIGGNEYTSCGYGGYGGGGGAGGNGGNGSCNLGGNGGKGICGYGGGGGGGGVGGGTSTGCDGGGDGGKGTYQSCTNGGNATNCGGGGGGTGCDCRCGGRGAGGLLEICYPIDGSFGFTSATGGNCCYECDGYCVHRFTSNGTFTIVS